MHRHAQLQATTKAGLIQTQNFMRSYYCLAVALLAVVIFAGCSKSSETPPPVKPKYPIVVTWVGTQMPGGGSSPAQLYYSFDLKSDSTITSQGTGSDGNTYTSAGKWSLKGTAFTATIIATNGRQVSCRILLLFTVVPKEYSRRVLSKLLQTLIPELLRWPGLSKKSVFGNWP